MLADSLLNSEIVLKSWRTHLMHSCNGLHSRACVCVCLCSACLHANACQIKVVQHDTDGICVSLLQHFDFFCFLFLQFCFASHCLHCSLHKLLKTWNQFMARNQFKAFFLSRLTLQPLIKRQIETTKSVVITKQMLAAFHILKSFYNRLVLLLQLNF